MKRRDFLAAGTAALALNAWPGWAADLKKFKLGVITDEVDDDLEKALIWAKGFGLEWVEIRNLMGRKYVTELNPDEVTRAKDLLAKYSIRLSVLDSAFFKITLPGTQSSLHNPRDAAKESSSIYDKQSALL